MENLRPKAKKLYVLVRRDLSSSQQAVQSCHAVAELSDWLRNHAASPRLGERSMVLLGVSGEAELLSWYQRLSSEDDVEPALFREEDLNSQATALAVLGVGAVAKSVRSLKLL